MTASVHNSRMAGEELDFQLAYDLYNNQNCNVSILKRFESRMPDNIHIFILIDDQVVQTNNYYDIKPEKIWALLRDNENSLYTINLKDDHNFETVRAGFVGLGIGPTGARYAIGYIHNNFQPKNCNEESIISEKICRFKRFYNDFVSSRAIRKFISGDERIKFVMNENHEIVWRLPGMDNQESFEPDKAPAFANYSNCSIGGIEYRLISYGNKIGPANQINSKLAVDEFADMVRDRLGAIKTSAGLLSAQEGKQLTKNDIALIDNILKASESINDNVIRLCKYSEEKQMEPGLLLDSCFSTENNKALMGLTEDRQIIEANWATESEIAIPNNNK